MARSITKKLGSEFPDKPSQILYEILTKVRSHQFDYVLQLLPIAQEVAKHTDIFQAITAGCKLSPDPDQTMATLKKILTEAGFLELATEIAPISNKRPYNSKKNFLWFKTPKKPTALESEYDSEKLGDEQAKAFTAPYLNTVLQNNNSKIRETTLKDKTQVFGQPSPVIKPLGFELEGQDAFSPSIFGDAWTIVKGTVLLNKKMKSKNDKK